MMKIYIQNSIFSSSTYSLDVCCSMTFVLAN